MTGFTHKNVQEKSERRIGGNAVGDVVAAPMSLDDKTSRGPTGGVGTRGGVSVVVS